MLAAEGVKLTGAAAGGAREHPRSDGQLPLCGACRWHAWGRSEDVLLGTYICSRSVELCQDEGGAPDDQRRCVERAPCPETLLTIHCRDYGPTHLVSHGAKLSNMLLTFLAHRQACIALSNHVLADSSFLTESASPIIELGAGAGLLSLLAARISNRMVVSTDVDPSVLAQLEGNIRSSRFKTARGPGQLADAVLADGLHNVVVAKELDWELSVSPEGREELLDWETTAFGAGERAQLILGADIVCSLAL